MKHSEQFNETDIAQSEIRTSDQINEIGAALAKAQSTMGHAVKDKENPFFKSHYADLASVKDVSQPQLNENGIAVITAPSTNADGSVTVTCRLLHQSGQWIETAMTAKALADTRGNVTAQALGSVATFLRRYTYSGMTNVATEDDDGEGAAGRTKSDGEKVTPTGKPKAKEPDHIDIAAADYVVPEEFWDRPNLGLAKEQGWKINDWLAHFGAYVEQAPTQDHLDRFWADNEGNIVKLSEVRQYWCREVWTARMSEMMPPDVTAAG